jgi:hypothetical protein
VKVGTRRSSLPACEAVAWVPDPRGGKEAILPSRLRADARECFLIVLGYGNMSCERTYLRGETLSCVRDDGSVIESRLDFYLNPPLKKEGDSYCV